MNKIYKKKNTCLPIKVVQKVLTFGDFNVGEFSEISKKGQIISPPKKEHNYTVQAILIVVK